MAVTVKLINKDPLYRLPELLEIIRNDFKSNFYKSNLVNYSYQKLSDDSGALIMNYEQYFIRISRFAGLSVFITESCGIQKAVITSIGGGTGLLNNSYGVNDSFAGKMASFLKKEGFMQIH